LSVVSGFVDKLRLKEQAEEDLYFARRDRVLLAARAKPQSRLAPGRLRVVSGGQSGVDRAALDAAMALGLAVGGWCPAGRGAEDGIIPECYPLTETPGRDHGERTAWNVRDSDATLILHRGPLAGGTRLTAEMARRLGRPLLCRDLTGRPDREDVLRWLWLNRVACLNCAGPRESEAPGIGRQAGDFLDGLFRRWLEGRA
jgi:hypothetical protein